MSGRERIGLGVGRTAVRAVLLRGNVIAWTAEKRLEEPATMTDTVAGLLAAAPARRIPRPPVIAAFSPALAQVKRIGGIPLQLDNATAGRLLHQNVGRHFLRNGVPLSEPVAFRSHGCWWGAVVDESTFAAIQDGCARARYTLAGCLPSVAALAELIRDGSVECNDGDARATLHVVRGEWKDVRRLRADGVIAPERVFDDALAAARSSRRSPLFLRARRDLRALHMALRVGSIATAVAALLLAIAAPGISASRRLASDTRELAALESRAGEWMPLASELRRSTDALDELAAFAASRRSALELLDALTEALPDSTAIVTLRVDSAGGSMTLLSRSATTVLPALAKSIMIASPRIGGSVTRETINGVLLQRVAVRFQVAPSDRRTGR